MVARKKSLAKLHGATCPTPNNANLATGDWLDKEAWRGTDFPEARMPSLVRGWRAARKHYYTFGLENVEAPIYIAYTDVANLFDY